MAAAGVLAEQSLAELEEIAITHRAFDRSVFARGAIEAARWMTGQGEARPAGLYSMQDVVSG